MEAYRNLSYNGGSDGDGKVLQTTSNRRKVNSRTASDLVGLRALLVHRDRSGREDQIFNRGGEVVDPGHPSLYGIIR